jgi:hypothetical protein
MANKVVITVDNYIYTCIIEENPDVTVSTGGDATRTTMYVPVITRISSNFLPLEDHAVEPNITVGAYETIPDVETLRKAVAEVLSCKSVQKVNDLHLIYFRINSAVTARVLAVLHSYSHNGVGHPLSEVLLKCFKNHKSWTAEFIPSLQKWFLDPESINKHDKSKVTKQMLHSLFNVVVSNYFFLYMKLLEGDEYNLSPLPVARMRVYRGSMPLGVKLDKLDVKLVCPDTNEVETAVLDIMQDRIDFNSPDSNMFELQARLNNKDAEEEDDNRVTKVAANFADMLDKRNSSPFKISKVCVMQFMYCINSALSKHITNMRFTDYDLKGVTEISLIVRNKSYQIELLREPIGATREARSTCTLTDLDIAPTTENTCFGVIVGHSAQEFIRWILSNETEIALSGYAPTSTPVATTFVPTTPPTPVPTKKPGRKGFMVDAQRVHIFTCTHQERMFSEVFKGLPVISVEKGKGLTRHQVGVN